MNTYRRDEKNIPKVFARVRTQLQVKEKELLELQRKDPCLLAPDCDQIDMLLDKITSLQLSTQDGSFVFASDSMCDDSSSALTSVCSTDFHSIKTLPSTIWLSHSRSNKQPTERCPSICNHLLSLPIKAYLPSMGTTHNHRIPIANHLLFMPISAFKPSSNTHSGFIEVKNNRTLQSTVVLSTRDINKSLLNHGAIYSKEYWLPNHPKATCASEIVYCT